MSTNRLVRPRWVWSGLVVAIVGACLLAVWFSTWRDGYGWGGGALLALGCGVGLYGGVLYDVHGSGSAGAELKALVQGRDYRGTAPGDMVQSGPARRAGRLTASETKALIRRAESTPRQRFYQPAAAALLLAAVFLVAVQGHYPQTPTGKNNAVHAIVVATLVALVGLRVLLAQHPGWLVSIIGALAGIALAVFGLMLRHDSHGMAVVEVVAGAWIFLASVLTLDHAYAAEGVADPASVRASQGVTAAQRIHPAWVVVVAAVVLVRLVMQPRRGRRRG